MKVEIFHDGQSPGTAAAVAGAGIIRSAIARRGCANVILASAASQFDVIATLLKEPELNWNAVSIFHLDEYIGLPVGHPAGFRRYLWERFVSKLPVPPAAFYPINGSAADPGKACVWIGEVLARHPIDVAFLGIGENGHIAFNDPPADFETESPYLVVGLDEKCRRQQLGEGWFPALEDVPKQAITMSVRQIMKSAAILCTVPDQRKAEAVKNALEGEITNRCPASILRTHPDATIYLDQASASLLEKRDA